MQSQLGVEFATADMPFIAWPGKAGARESPDRKLPMNRERFADTSLFLIHPLFLR